MLSPSRRQPYHNRKDTSIMGKFRLAVAAALVALLGIAVSTIADANTCQTRCYRFGNENRCETNCY